METFSALLAFCAGNSSVTGEFPAQRPAMRSFVAFFDLRQNERFSKQWWGCLFETPSRPLWRHHNEGNYNPQFTMRCKYTCISLHEIPKSGLKVLIYPQQNKTKQRYVLNSWRILHQLYQSKAVSITEMPRDSSRSVVNEVICSTTNHGSLSL